MMLERIFNFLRPKGNVVDQLEFVVSLIYVGLVLYYAATFFEDTKRYGILFLSISLVLSGLFSIKGKGIPFVRGKWKNVVVGLIVFLALFIGIYFYEQYRELMFERINANTSLDFIIAGIALLLVLVLTLKDMGYVVPLLTVLFLFYAIFGSIFPGFFHHFGITPVRLLQIMVLEIDGIFGQLNQLGATWIAVFVMYAGFVWGFGGMELIMALAAYVLKISKAALPQVPVITSMLMGSFSGSAAANVAGTGSFTIPLMKKSGIPPHYAAAIESIASTGGQAMPPVMGATAFIMCDYLNVSYLKIVAMGFAPALVYYACCVSAVYFVTKKMTIGGADDFSSIGPVVRNRRHLIEKAIAPLGSMAFLFFLLGYYQLGISISGFYATAFLLLMKLFTSLVFYKRKGISDYIRGLAAGIKFGSRNMVPIAIVLACVGIMARVLTTTGLAQKLTFSMVDIGGGNVVVLLFLIGAVAILFGMAIAVTATYILVVLVGAPALSDLGIELAVCHFMVFYLAILAAITPPVAGAVLVASGIAKSPYMKTALTTAKMSLPLFLLPYTFYVYPELVMGHAVSYLIALKVFVGLSGIIYGVLNDAPGRLSHGIIKRILCLAAGFSVSLGFYHSMDWAFLGVIILIVGSDLIPKRGGSFLYWRKRQV